jgi:cytochrome P450
MADTVATDDRVDAVDMAERLSRFDVFDSDQRKWDDLAHARAHCPVVHTSADGGMWLVSRYDDVRAVLSDPATYSASGTPIRPSPLRLPPLDADPPLQPELRAILNPYFGPGRLKRFVPTMRALAAELVDAFAARGECEFITEFAIPYSAGVLARVIFDERDESRVVHAVRVVTTAAEESTSEAFFELALLAGQYLAEREESGERRDDLLDGVLHGTVSAEPVADGPADVTRRLSDDERIGAVITVLLGGLDTTRATFGNLVGHLARDPSLEARLRTPGWDRRDLDEFLRLDSAVTAFGRTVTRDTELAGVSLRAGERVLVHYASANRDERRFAHADRLDFDTARPGHAAFGIGIHRCLGSHLARIQLAVGVAELLARVTALRLTSEIEYAPGFVHGPRTLPLRFAPHPAGTDAAAGPH